MANRRREGARRTALTAVVLALLAMTLPVTPLAAQGGPDPTPPTLEDLLESGSCVAHGLNVPGQGVHLSGSGVHLSGSVGGMVLGPITFSDDTGANPDVTLTPLTTTEVLMPNDPAGLMPYVQQDLQHDVVIFVADDFGDDPSDDKYAVPAQVFGFTDDPADRQALKDLVQNGQFSHGALVMHHLNALIAATEAFTLDASTASRFVWHHRSSQHRLIVAALDLSAVAASRLITAQDVFGGLTDSLVAEVAALKAEIEPELDLGGVVVNMSWVFLPCLTVEDFLADIDKYPSLDAYLEALGITNSSVSFADVMMLLREVDHPDLEALLERGSGMPGPTEPVSFVAASGNFSLPYQMLPAGWSQVVGVGVAPVQPPPFPGRYSNVADVIVPGEWIALQAWDGAPSLGMPTDLSYAGTSFAAPLVSLYVAEDLVGQMQCIYVRPSPPPLTKGNPKIPGDVLLPIAIGAC